MLNSFLPSGLKSSMVTFFCLLLRVARVFMEGTSHTKMLPIPCWPVATMAWAAGSHDSPESVAVRINVMRDINRNPSAGENKYL